MEGQRGLPLGCVPYPSGLSKHVNSTFRQARLHMKDLGGDGLQIGQIKEKIVG